MNFASCRCRFDAVSPSRCIIIANLVVVCNALSGPDPLRTRLDLTVSEACSMGDPILYADDV